MAFSRSSSVICGGSLILLCLQLIEAMAVDGASGRERPTLVHREELCKVEGDADLYGFGVRLGITRSLM